MENNFQLMLNNKEVFDFYKKSQLDFEHINIMFVDILKKLIADLDSSVNSNLASKLLDKFNMLDHKIESITSSVSMCKTDITTSFELKMNEYRKEYIESLKQILTVNNAECIAPLIKESNNTLLDKTSLIISDLLPKNHDSLSKDITSHFKLFQSTIASETTKLLASSLDKKTIDDFFSKIVQTMGQSQNALITVISTSESRLENKLVETERKMNEIKEISTLNNSANQTLQTNVTEMLKKFEKGSTKGNVSEHITYNILLSLFPCAQIDHVGNEQKETGDIVLVRNNKPKILIENKDHTSTNVPKSEVEKFIRDCEIQNCCGIMLAQHRGIANKQNFELQLNNGNVLLYIHEVNFDKEKIKMAIDIVEQFKFKIDETFDNEDDCIIDKDTLNEINKEFSNYVCQKTNMLKLLKDFGEKMNFSINDLKLPVLEKYLSSNFASASLQTENMCKYCEKHVPKSLLQHYRYCPSKKDFDTLNDSAIKNIVVPAEKNIVISTEKGEKGEKKENKIKK